MNELRQNYMKTHSKDLIKLIEEDDLMQIPSMDKVDMIKDLHKFEDMAIGNKIEMPEIPPYQGEQQLDQDHDDQEDEPVQKKKKKQMMMA